MITSARSCCITSQNALSNIKDARSNGMNHFGSEPRACHGYEQISVTNYGDTDLAAGRHYNHKSCRLLTRYGRMDVTALTSTPQNVCLAREKQNAIGFNVIQQLPRHYFIAAQDVLHTSVLWILRFRTLCIIYSTSNIYI